MKSYGAISNPGVKLSESKHCDMDNKAFLGDSIDHEEEEICYNREL